MEITTNIQLYPGDRDREKGLLLMLYRSAAEAILAGGKSWPREMNRKLKSPISISKTLTFE